MGNSDIYRVGNFRTRFAAIAASVALLATACGGGSETQTATTDDFGPAITQDSAAVVDSQTPAVESQPAPSAAAGPPSDVLAYAIESAQELSYSFEQDLSMQMSIMGQELNIDDVTIATGVVSNGDQSINMDIGAFMTAMFESFGLDSADPAMGVAFGGFEDLEMNMWVVDNQLVMDLSDFTNTLAGLDPASAGDLSVFANGPVSIDLDRLEEFGFNDALGASDLASQFGQGASLVDPADMVESLRSIDELTESGSGNVNGVNVTVYSASVNLAEYSAALGQDPQEQLGQIDDLGLSGDEFFALLEDLEVDMTISLDDEGLVREVTTIIDMGAFMSNLAAETGDPELGSVEMTMGTSQRFDNYGDDFEITAPAATDVTSELAGLIDS